MTVAAVLQSMGKLLVPHSRSNRSRFPGTGKKLIKLKCSLCKLIMLLRLQPHQGMMDLIAVRPEVERQVSSLLQILDSFKSISRVLQQDPFHRCHVEANK